MHAAIRGDQRDACVRQRALLRWFRRRANACIVYTDHGTATVALLVGGALKGGRVITDWPGLKAADLYQGRDLKPTTDLRAVLKGVLKDHLRADERAFAQNVFPGSDAIKPMSGLLA